MRIELTSVYVDDQDKARAFYTKVLGFVLRDDIPMDGGMRWLTVVSPENPKGSALVLEPSDKPATQAFKKAMYEQGTPLILLTVDDVWSDYKRLQALGVRFMMPPTAGGMVTMTIFGDTCGNWVMIAQPDA